MCQTIKYCRLNAYIAVLQSTDRTDIICCSNMVHDVLTWFAAKCTYIRAGYDGR